MKTDNAHTQTEAKIVQGDRRLSQRFRLERIECVCVCEREREREREREERERGRERGGEREKKEKRGREREKEREKGQGNREREREREGEIGRKREKGKKSERKRERVRENVTGYPYSSLPFKEIVKMWAKLFDSILKLGALQKAFFVIIRLRCLYTWLCIL